MFALENGRLGPYALNLGLNGNRLVFDLRDPEGQPIFAHVLALSPFRMVIKDYFMICASYYDAIRNATAEKIEAIDMARRGTHNEGAELVAERLKGKIRTDFDTSRRIFTLIAALVWTRPRDMSVRDMSGGDERTTKRPSSVLFACSMNAVRSPMAEGLAKSIVGRSIFIDSAGLNKEPLDMFALAVMREAGVDIAGTQDEGLRRHRGRILRSHHRAFAGGIRAGLRPSHARRMSASNTGRRSIRLLSAIRGSSVSMPIAVSAII